MTRDVRVGQLTPLQRLQLRDSLQDRWREQVRQITLLGLARHDHDDRGDVRSPIGASTDVRALDAAIHRARGRLENLEQAMRRLDDRSYGHCRGCGEQIGYTRLAQTPEETRCARCARDASVRPGGRADVGVA